MLDLKGDFYVGQARAIGDHIMTIKTKIHWCDSTCNPTMGCDGCELWTKTYKSCYAGWLHVRFGGRNDGYAPAFKKVTLFSGRMAEAARWPDLSNKVRHEKPWLNGLPRLIFVSDMTDSLSAAVPFDFLAEEVIANVSSDLGKRHQWLWLTKRSERMASFCRWLKQPWPSNLWAGTSVTSQATAKRINGLLKVGDKATIRFLSVEPQIEELDLTRWLPHLTWVIQGGESGRTARPFQMEWAKSLRAQCKDHGVPYFLKQLGSHVCRNAGRVLFKDAHAGDWSEWPKELRVRKLPLRPLLNLPRAHRITG